MKITLKRLNQDYHFELENERGHKLNLDNRAEYGGHDLAPSPMELLLMGVAGCSAIDIISILKKQRQNITDYRAEVIGERVQIEDAKPFKTIFVQVFLTGEIDEAKAQKAAELSFQKYCSVSKTLEPTAEIKYQVFINQ
jgi:putative redox protein